MIGLAMTSALSLFRNTKVFMYSYAAVGAL
jgi:hypothetical protein